MQKYIGVKLVEAEPCEWGTWMTMKNNEPSRPCGRFSDDEQGYIVVYPNGYESWCPKDAFEEANRPIDGMTFGHAIEAAKKGMKIARRGWNGKNMFVFLREGRQITGVDASTPMGGDFESLGHFCMRTVDGKCCVGWLASQTDMLAEDWMIVT